MGHEPLALFKLSTCLEGEIACRDRWRLLLAILVISNGGIACNVRRLLPAQRGGGSRRRSCRQPANAQLGPKLILGADRCIA